jgi:hypothetical protein
MDCIARSRAASTRTPSCGTPGRGKPRLSFSVAVDQSYTPSENRPEPETGWIRGTAWEDTAEALGESSTTTTTKS